MIKWVMTKDTRAHILESLSDNGELDLEMTRTGVSERGEVGIKLTATHKGKAIMELPTQWLGDGDTLKVEGVRISVSVVA